MTRDRVLPQLIALLTLIGCDDRAAKIAHEAAERQARQNLEMSRVNQGVLKLTHQLQQERAELNGGRDALETERRAIAADRRTESAVAVLAGTGGSVLAALFALGLAWTILMAAHRGEDGAEVFCELITSDLSKEFRQLAPPTGGGAGISPPAITADATTQPRELS